MAKGKDIKGQHKHAANITKVAVSKIRNGKGYEHAVFGMLTLAGIDVYEPLVDDQGIDGIIRHNSDQVGPVYYDLQIKGSKDWAGVRGKVSFCNRGSILVIYCAKDRELLWFFYEDVKTHFPAKDPQWGDIFLSKLQVEHFRKEGRSNLSLLKEHLSGNNR